MENIDYINKVLEDIYVKKNIDFDYLEESIKLYNENRYISSIPIMRTFIESYLRKQLIRKIVDDRYKEELTIFPWNRPKRIGEVSDEIENWTYKNKQVKELIYLVIKIRGNKDQIEEIDSEWRIKIPQNKLNEEEKQTFENLIKNVWNKTYWYGDICKLLKEWWFISKEEKTKRINYYREYRNCIMHWKSITLRENTLGKKNVSTTVCWNWFSNTINIPNTYLPLVAEDKAKLNKKIMWETLEICWDILKKFYKFN